MDEEYVQVDIMHVALTAIANEMQRFHAGMPTSNTNENNVNLETLIKCKSSLKLKKKQVQKLKEHLKIACDIAKTVISAKENSTGLLKSHLILAKSEGAVLSEKQNKNIQVINCLTIENKILSDRIQDLGSFIAIGYKELQKIRKERSEELPIAMQLKKLISCCCQYYADYCNEHARCMQLEQSNRFLYNKANILENTIEAISEERRNLRYHNSRLSKENTFMKDKYVRTKTLKSIDLILCSKCRIENQIIFPNEIPNNSDVTETLKAQIYELDLTSHLCTVKQLLCDQNSLLEDLQDISNEFCIK